MAKKRKTREQKKLADLRHTFTHAYTSLVNTPSFNLGTSFAPKTEAKPVIVYESVYPYLKKDLAKTAILTAGILLSQAVLFTILKNHIIMIPGLTY